MKIALALSLVAALLPAACMAQTPPAAPAPTPQASPTPPPATPTPGQPPQTEYYDRLGKLPMTEETMDAFQGNLAQILQDAFAVAPEWTEDHVGVSKIRYTRYAVSVDSGGVLRIALQSVLHIEGRPERADEVWNEWIDVKPSRITSVAVEPVMMPRLVECSREAYQIILQGPGRVTPFELRRRVFHRGSDIAKSEAEASLKVRLQNEAVEAVAITLPCDDQQANAIGRAFRELVTLLGGHATFTPLPPFFNVPLMYQ